MKASEWTKIFYIKWINPGRSFDELYCLGFEEPYENMRHRFMIVQMRSCDDSFSRTMW